MSEVYQGDILRIENVKVPVLVVSKDIFNKTGEILGCPIYKTGSVGALRIEISGEPVTGYVHCEKIALFDLNVRGYSKLDSISMADRIVISDVIQSLFEYV